MPDGQEQMAGAQPQGGAPATSSQGQASGPGGASMPVPNRGLEAAAMAKLAVHIQALQTLLAVLPAGSDIASDVRDGISKMAKHVPPGEVSQGVQMTEQQRNLMQQRQQSPQIAAMRAAQMQQMPGQQQGQQQPQPQAA